LFGVNCFPLLFVHGVCVFLSCFFGVFFFFPGVFRRIWENRVGVYSSLVAGLGVLDFVFFQKRGCFWWQQFCCWCGFGRFLASSRGYWRRVHIVGSGCGVRWQFRGIWVVWACIGVWAVHFGMWAFGWGFPAVCRGGWAAFFFFLLYVASRLGSAI
jgi:hypothetical protein